MIRPSARITCSRPASGSITDDQIRAKLSQIHGNINQQLTLMVSEAGIRNGQWNTFREESESKGQPLSNVLLNRNPKRRQLPIQNVECPGLANESGL